MSYGMSGLIWGCVMFAIIVLMYVPFAKAYAPLARRPKIRKLPTTGLVTMPV